MTREVLLESTAGTAAAAALSKGVEESKVPALDGVASVLGGLGRGGLRPGDVLGLQPVLGNRAVQGILARRALVSRSAQGMEPSSGLGERDDNGVAEGAEAVVAGAESSSSSPLPAGIQRAFEGSLGADLSAVRVHTGTQSAEAAHAVGAKAYTVGQDIHFGAGQYSPEEPEGARLVAHEVAHTVQHGAGAAERHNQLQVSTPHDSAEVEAERAADAMVAGQAFEVGGVGAAVNRSAVLMRDDGPAPAATATAGPAPVPANTGATANGVPGAAPPSVSTHDLPFADADQEAIRKGAIAALPIWADTFANLWYSANNGALGTTAEPEDPDFTTAQGRQAKLAFGIALAGNLVWAATCLTPAGAGATIAMSFGGAAVGSGAIAVAMDPPTSTQPSFRSMAATALARARDKLAQTMKGLVNQVAEESAIAKVTDVEEQKTRLWAKAFTTEYDQAEPIEKAAAAKLAPAASNFVAQWQAYKATAPVAKEAARRADERIKRDGYPWTVKARILLEPSGPGGPADEYWLEVYNEELLKYATETFHPVLKLT